MKEGKWKPAFMREVCGRFASGESIAEIADASGNTEWEIEELLKAHAAIMKEALRRAEAMGGTTRTNDERTSRMRYSFTNSEGETARGYTLYNENGDWLGHVTLEYNDGARWGRLMCVTDFGNYGYQWNGTGGDFLKFLSRCSDGYITEKMSMGHGEGRVIDANTTRAKIEEAFLEIYGDEDSDWAGERLSELEDCECEADFYAWAQEAEFEEVYRRFTYGWGGYLRGLRERLLPELKRVLASQ